MTTTLAESAVCSVLLLVVALGGCTVEPAMSSDKPQSAARRFAYSFAVPLFKRTDGGQAQFMGYDGFTVDLERQMIHIAETSSSITLCDDGNFSPCIYSDGTFAVSVPTGEWPETWHLKDWSFRAYSPAEVSILGHTLTVRLIVGTKKFPKRSVMTQYLWHETCGLIAAGHIDSDGATDLSWVEALPAIGGSSSCP